LILLLEVGRKDAAADDPEATAVAQLDDRQRRQHADEQTAEQSGLHATSYRAPAAG
jgi:hypothetical protein